MSRTFEHQVNELHIRASILNQFTELVCPQKVAVASSRLGSGEVWPGTDLCNSAVYIQK